MMRGLSVARSMLTIGLGPWKEHTEYFMSSGVKTLRGGDGKLHELRVACYATILIVGLGARLITMPRNKSVSSR